ncbi:MAG: hypothetical protein K0R12_1262 [Gammaproteobacteria bacterium]|jgi:hypothetical protein|nr:hypothetical protein [Gammaproteobacteria bacterium]
MNINNVKSFKYDPQISFNLCADANPDDPYCTLERIIGQHWISARQSADEIRQQIDILTQKAKLEWGQDVVWEIEGVSDFPSTTGICEKRHFLDETYTLENLSKVANTLP